MIIDVSKVDQSQFVVSKHVVAGEGCTFIHAQNIMTDWTEQTLKLRSVIINPEGKIISASYPKFFNFEEKPAIYPFNGDLNGCSFIEKVDGSTLIVSYYKGEMIIRTRGSIDTTKMENHYEIVELMKMYYTFFEKYLPELNGAFSVIFEWVSPKNRIVIGYDRPDLYLTNVIEHSTYKLAKQDKLDSLAKELGFKRPERYKFNTLPELLETIKKLEGKEGICLYYDDDQHIRKVKSDWYLKAHAFKAQMNIKTILELYQDWKPATRQDFEKQIEQQFDYECLNFSKPYMDDLYNRLENVHKQVDSVKKFIEDNKGLPQKEFAISLVKSYNGPLKSIGFSLRKNPDANISGCIKDLVLENVTLESSSNKT